MKRLSGAGFILLVMLIPSCKKSGKTSCRESSGGFIPTYSRVFYKARDFGGGPVAIEVTRENGSSLVQGYLKDSYPGRNVTCSTTSGVIRVSVGIGEGFKYRAYDANRTWTGTVGASCTPNSCETIEIK